MNRATKLGMLALVMLVLAVRPALAAESSPQTYVLLVGIDHFADDHILPRQHAEADAKALYDLFRSPDRLGVDEQHMQLLLGKPDKKRPSQPASRDNILKALKWLQTKPGPKDLVLLAFIGQGGPVGERLCFFAADSTFKDRKKNAIASGDIEQAVDRLKTQRFVAFIDVFFLGFKDAKKLGLDPNITDLGRVFFGKEDGKGLNPSRVLFFNGGIKPVLDLKKHGLFTQVLLDGLRGKADVQGYEPDGVVTVAELAKYFKKELPELARKRGKTDAEKDQLPGVFEGQTSDFVLVRNPAAYPKAHERLVKFGRLAKEQQLSKDLTEEGNNLLARMPKLEAKQNLRKAFQKLADGTETVADFQAERKTILASTMIYEKEANDYALMVLKATQAVRNNFFKEVNKGQLVDSAIRGLYRDINEKLPAGIRERLEKVKSLKDAGLLKLLADARTHLGKREDLAAGKDITLSLHPMLHKLD